MDRNVGAHTSDRVLPSKHSNFLTNYRAFFLKRELFLGKKRQNRKPQLERRRRLVQETEQNKNKSFHAASGIHACTGTAGWVANDYYCIDEAQGEARALAFGKGPVNCEEVVTRKFPTRDEHWKTG